MESLHFLTGTVSSNIYKLWEGLHREASPQCRMPAEPSPFLFDLLQANFFDMNSMEDHLKQFGMLEADSALLFFFFSS